MSSSVCTIPKKTKKKQKYITITSLHHIYSSHSVLLPLCISSEYTFIHKSFITNLHFRLCLVIVVLMLKCVCNQITRSTRNPFLSTYRLHYQTRTMYSKHTYALRMYLGYHNWYIRTTPTYVHNLTPLLENQKLHPNHEKLILRATYVLAVH